VPTRTILLPAIEPFDGQSLLAFLRARAVSGVEEVTAGTYGRSLRLERGGGVVTVTVCSAGIGCELALDDLADADGAAARCRRLFDLDADPGDVSAVLGRDPLLRALVRRRPGLRVPGAVDGFELAVRAIVGQQVSVAGARTVLGGLVAEYGEPLGPDGTGAPGALTHRFPVPAALAQADPGAFPFPRTRADALIEVARLAASGELRLDPPADAAETRAQLRAVRGIGPWTASYIAMRALGGADAFLPGDVGVRHALARLPGEADPELWRPFRSYAVMHLWHSLDR
jgi:AraC family transcriptional regulator, regulatory protein of adaptative response / DNA-3-methyladenine glycosylase II